jgi:capsular polysaccharide biosynthesis protein
VLPAHGLLFVIAAAFVLTAVLSIAIAYAADYLDSSFHTPAQVADTLGIPVVIAMPKRTA